MSELRQNLRNRAKFAGLIGTSAAQRVPCTVQDISSTGARVTVRSSTTVPDNFTLQIPHVSATHMSEVVWRRGSELGVRFVRAKEPAGR
jgi:hypothetical protein